MKRIFKTTAIWVKALIIAPKTPSQLLNGLNIKDVWVHYKQAYILGVFREEQIRCHRVAVKSTCDNPTGFKKDGDWMLNIILERARLSQIIGELEYCEAIIDAQKFSFGSLTGRAFKIENT